MTENEAIKRIKEFGLHHAIGDLPYSELTVKAFEMAIKSLEEIQQYRAIETELREHYHANVDIKMLLNYFIETIFKGEKHEGFRILTNEDKKMWEEYKTISTVEECRNARERQMAKKPLARTHCKDGKHPLSQDIGRCPSCNSIVEEDILWCDDCGQKLDWSE